MIQHALQKADIWRDERINSTFKEINQK